MLSHTLLDSNLWDKTCQKLTTKHNKAYKDKKSHSET